MKDYTGIIIKESLDDSNLINSFQIIKVVKESISPRNKWHLYTVKVSKEDIPRISKHIISNKYYIHFWKGKEIIVAFKHKIFTFNHDNKTSWKPAVDYGISIGIPKEQLDFPIE